MSSDRRIPGYKRGQGPYVEHGARMPVITIIDPDLDGKPKFATLDIVLGSLYITACVLELFGVVAAVMVRQYICCLRLLSLNEKL